MDREIFKQIKSNIRKSKKYADLSAEYQQKTFELLDYIGIELDTVKTNAENAGNLQEAITCYISYGEYSFDDLMKEIKNSIIETGR